MRKLYPFLFLLLACALIVPCVKAKDEINLTDFPAHLAEQLGVSLFAGQLFASLILISLAVLPTLLLTKHLLGPLIIGLPTLAICIGLGWLPVYIFAILTLLIALLFADKIAKRF